MPRLARRDQASLHKALYRPIQEFVVDFLSFDYAEVTAVTLIENVPELPLLMALAFVLGFALHKGSICAVVATRELLFERRPDRFIGFLECALWATIALIALHAYPMEMPTWSNWSLLAPGAFLFSVGAFVNGACAFGMVGRIGNGEFEYLLGFVGIYFGVSLAEFFAIAARASPSTISEPFASPVLVAFLLCGMIVVRYLAGHHRGGAFLQLTVIMAAVGASFVAIGEVEPTWPLTAIIATAPLVPFAALTITVCLMAGTIVSGASSGRRFRLLLPTFRGMVRRIVGGAMMGGGAALVPGSNDSLLLFGLPSGAPQAIAAYGILVVTIAALTAVFGSSAKPWTSSI